MSSLWLSNKILNNSFDSLNNDIFTDVCVIGGGIFGLSSAYYLSKQNIQTTLIDESFIASKTTGHTSAKITSQHGIIYSYLVQNYGIKFAKDYLFANQLAIDNIENIINNEDIKCNFERQSAFVYTNNSSNISKIQNEVSCLNNIGFPAKFVTQTNLPFDISAAIEFKQQAQFNPVEYCYGLCTCIKKYGGNIYSNTKALSIKNKKNHFIIHTPHGKITAKFVIIATHYPFINFPGMYFSKMYQSSSYVIAVDSKTDLFNGMYISDDFPNYSFRTYTYNNKKLLLLGGFGHKTGKLNNSDNFYIDLENYAKKFYPDGEVLFKWNTRDCITLDKIPYIGNFSNLVDNIYIGTGFNKWGMTSSNVAAKIITDKIIGQKNNYSYVFDSTRFNPIKNRGELKNIFSDSINSLVVNRIKKSKTSFSDIKPDSGGIIEMNNKKVGIYKDITRKSFCC